MLSESLQVPEPVARPQQQAQPVKVEPAVGGRPRRAATGHIDAVRLRCPADQSAMCLVEAASAYILVRDLLHDSPLRDLVL